MANVSLKANFKDGDKLLAVQLNNNFLAIKAALEALNKISWQDDTSNSLMYFKGTTEEVASREIIEGQLLYDLTLGEAYIDHNNRRIDIVSGTVLDVVVNSLDGNQTTKAPSVAAVKNYVLAKNDVAILTGTITADGNQGSALLYYPEGFNKTNCVVISAMINASGEGGGAADYWMLGTSFDTSCAGTGAFPVRVSLTDGNIRVLTKFITLSSDSVKINTFPTSYTYTCKIVLMKIN